MVSNVANVFKYLGLIVQFLADFQAGRLTNISAAIVPAAQLLYHFGLLDQATYELILNIAGGGIGLGLARKPLQSPK